MTSINSLRLRSALAVGASALALTAMSAPAFAQAKDPSDFTIEELVVTAEKREQALQDVPVAVSAFTSSQRDVVGMTNVQDFVNFTPGMNYSGTDRISLRGAGRNTFYVGNDPGVATYSDGFYSASSSELFKTPLFVERTEILRGPQGTLYGRNAMGGAVNTISKHPAHDFGGEIRASYGNYDHSKVEGVVSIPVAEHLRFKVGGSQDYQREGFIKNIGTANDGGTIKRTYFEFQAEAELGDNATAWLRYSRTSWDDTTGVGDRLSNTITPYDTTRVFQPIGGLLPNPQYGYTTANPGASDPYKMNTNTNGYGQLRGNHLLTAQVTYDLGWADLKYIGGFQQYNYQTGGDYDGTSRTTAIAIPGMAVPYYPDQTTDFNEHKRYYSNEINLSSKADGPLTWILGLYQYHEEYAQRIQLADPQQTQLAQPLTLTGALAAANPSRDFADQQARLTSKAYAVFGQATYKFNDAWSVTGGLRYTKDEKDGYEYQRLVLLSPSLFAGAVAFDVSSDMDPTTPGVQNYRSLSGSWDAVTGTLDVDFTPDRDSLYYAKYSRGYKSGGFLLGTLAPQPEAKQEGVDAFELGMKKTIARRLILNGSLFYNTYKDLQLNLQQLNAAGTASANNFVNVDARAYGLELEAQWQPIQPLQFIASYGYLNTEITKGCCFYDPADPSALLASAKPKGGTATSNGVLLVFQDLKGSQLFQSPENKFAFNGNYTFDFTPGSLILSATYTWTDKTIYQPFKDPAFEVPAYGTADFRVLWKDADEKYSIIGYVKNAFDEQGYTSTGSTNPTAVFANPNPGLVVGGKAYLQQTGVAINRGLIQPRTYGVELQYRF
ncbi:TonB-dependent receptor [Phenylobacterium aquaticum]|uniref:TonB-dependent receptor n=1 Tax=Phenylobacterium aquaticum TaxID=1763816 RepID=UPI001F5C7D4E|nr:TonB-dependent receptor [Phenylobacterium aquaticum]MCI3131625.1 TonB-dependent receptor [Phenylobacterium aquaticum]